MNIFEFSSDAIQNTICWCVTMLSITPMILSATPGTKNQEVWRNTGKTLWETYYPIDAVAQASEIKAFTLLGK